MFPLLFRLTRTFPHGGTAHFRVGQLFHAGQSLASAAETALSPPESAAHHAGARQTCGFLQPVGECQRRRASNKQASTQ
jgi:hypothetical protein